MTSTEKLASLYADQHAKLDEIARIKEQLERSRARPISEIDADQHEWIVRANRALRHKNIDLLKINQELGALNRAIKQERHAANESGRNEYSERFIAVARQVLAKETFLAISAAAALPGKKE